LEGKLSKVKIPRHTDHKCVREGKRENDKEEFTWTARELKKAWEWFAFKSSSESLTALLTRFLASGDIFLGAGITVLPMCQGSINYMKVQKI